MTKLWQKNLRQIDPYVPGEQPKIENVIKLNANENPYPPSPQVEKVLRDTKIATFKLYPNANSTKLKQALADRENLKTSQVFVANGSDEVIALAYQSFFCSEKPILFPDITYSFYPVWCDLLKTPFETVKLDENFRINPRDFDRENGGVIFPNPNAPTGIAENLDFLEDILKNNQDCVVIIDEAYVDFGTQSAVSLIDKYENLLVVQTFSKSRSLAGLRIGMAYGSETLIATLEAVKNSYNSYTMDAIAIEAGTASVLDEQYFKDSCNKIIETRAETCDELAKLGFVILPSTSNFVLVTHPTLSAWKIFEDLRAQNIFIRYFNLPRINNHLRITIGTDEEMNVLIEALKKMV